MLDKTTELVDIFSKHGVEYLLIGKAAAMLYGYPGTTQDIDIFPKKSAENCLRLLNALKEIGFDMDEPLQKASKRQRDLDEIPRLEAFRNELKKERRY